MKISRSMSGVRGEVLCLHRHACDPLHPSLSIKGGSSGFSLRFGAGCEHDTEESAPISFVP